MEKSILFLLMILLTACSPTAEAHNYGANQAFYSGDYSGALRGYQQAQVQNPDAMPYYFNGALAYAEMGQLNQALDSMLFALEKSNGESADIYYNLGNIYARMGRYQDAIGTYQAGLKVDSGHEDMRYNLEAVLLLMVENPLSPSMPPPPAPDPSGDDDNDDRPDEGDLTLEQALAILEQIEQNQRAWQHFNRAPDEGNYHDGDAW